MGKIASPALTRLSRPAKVLLHILERVNSVNGQHEPSQPQQQFENFTASSLYCEKCKAAMPVRERLLLILPDKEVYDYLCTGCASSVGQREVTAGDKMMAQAAASRRPRRAAPVQRSDALTRQCAIVFIGTGEIGLPTLRSVHRVAARIDRRGHAARQTRRAEPAIQAPPIKAAVGWLEQFRCCNRRGSKRAK